MPRNIEIKLRCDHLPAIRDRAVAAGAEDRGTLLQTDTFFGSLTGRLKLREISSDRSGHHAELIWYARADVLGTKGSDYIVSPVAEVATMRAALAAACGIRQTVRKRRDLLLWRNVRIHLDRVDVLGNFVELESVIGAEVGEALATSNLDELMLLLGLSESQSVAVAYADLLESGRAL